VAINGRFLVETVMFGAAGVYKTSTTKKLPGNNVRIKVLNTVLARIQAFVDTTYSGLL
jgi:hypothetical protein